MLDMMDDDCDAEGFYEEPHEKSRMKISKRKTPEKSDHKHDYGPVLISHQWEDCTHYSAGVKCKICGNVRPDDRLFETLTKSKFPLLGFTSDHFIEEYKNLEIVEECK